MKKTRSIRVAVAFAGPRASCPARWCEFGPADIVCAGCHPGIQNLLRYLSQTKPDLILLSDPPSRAIAHAIRLLLTRFVAPSVPLLVISASPSPGSIGLAFQRGIRGYLTLPIKHESLADAVRKVFHGESVVEVETSRAFAYPLTATEGAAALPAVLSERQIQVLVCVAQGLQNKEIATELRIEPGTVHAHLQRAFKKLAVHRKAEALEKLLCPTFPRAPEVPQIGTAEDHFRNSWPQTWREVQERFGTEQACQDFLS